MIGYLPLPCPDELFYSTIARLYRDSGHPIKKHFHRYLYGDRSTPSRSLLFPAGLDKIVTRLPDNHPMTTETAIRNHSPVPLVAPFITANHGDAMVRWITTGISPRQVRGILARTLFGHYTSGFYYCPLCMEEDYAKYDDVYWHRIHQLGMEVCPVHGAALHHVVLGDLFDWVTLDEVCDRGNPSVVDGEAIEEQRLLGRDAMWLLENRLNMGFAEEMWSRYTNVLREQDLMKYDGYFKVGRLREIVKLSISPGLAARLGLGAGDRGRDWLDSMFLEGKPKAAPIVRHLVLIRALGFTPETFFALSAQPKPPFGSGPWHCLNPVCPKSSRATIRRVAISKDYYTRRPLGTFVCEHCGFVYQRLGPDESLAKLSHKICIVTYGPVWVNEFKRMYYDTSISQKFMAKRLKFSNASFRGLVLELGLAPEIRPQGPGPIQQWDSDIRRMWGDASGSLGEIAQEIGCSARSVTLYAQAVGLPQKRDFVPRHWVDRDEGRRDFLKILQSHPHTMRRELANCDKALYRCLQENDAEWFEAHVPPPLHRGQRSTVDWNERDRHVVAYVPKAYAFIVDQNRRQLIGCDSILKVLRAEFNVRVSTATLPKMPLTQAAIDGLTESHDEYVERRVRWGIQQLKQQGMVVTKHLLLTQYPDLKRHLDTPQGLQLISGVPHDVVHQAP